MHYLSLKIKAPFFITALLCLQTGYAQVTLTGKVTGADNGRGIPFAHVYLNDNSTGTVTNSEGEFTLKLDSLPQLLTFSHTSYVTKGVVAKQSGKLLIELVPGAISLSDVTIMPRDVEKLILEAFKTGIAGLENKCEVSLFYRQITKTSDTPNEMIEAFFSGTVSTAGIESMKMVNGRFAKIPYDSVNRYPSLTNFYYMSSLPVIQKVINDVVLPLNKDFKKYFSYEIKEIVEAGDGETIVVVSFQPLSRQKAIFEGDIYIDSGSKNVVRMQGSINDDLGLQFSEKGIKAEDAVYMFDISFNLSEGGSQPLLSSVKTDLTFNYVVGQQSRPVLVTSSIVAFEYQGSTGKKTKRVTNKRNLIADIKQTEYDSKFWEDNPIIARTLNEQKVIDAFEAANLFKFQTGPN